MISPGFFFSPGTEVALRFAHAGSRSVSLYSEPPAASAPVRPCALGVHMPKAKTAVASANHQTLAYPPEDPPDLDESHF